MSIISDWIEYVAIERPLANVLGSAHRSVELNASTEAREGVDMGSMSLSVIKTHTVAQLRERCCRILIIIVRDSLVCGVEDHCAVRVRK